MDARAECTASRLTSTCEKMAKPEKVNGMYTEDSTKKNHSPKAAPSKGKRNADGGLPPKIDVLKTYKLFIGGAFPRTESGRYYPIHNPEGKFLANVCLGSRKDFRNAVVAARGAQSAWQDRTAYNKSQILYRLAEMLGAKSALFIDEMQSMGMEKREAEREFQTAVDLLVYYAGWCDKFVQVFSAVNPVASSHFNFSLPEPMGVVGALAPESHPLLGLVQAVAPTIAGGNTVVALASESMPLTALTFAEVVATSDVPAGVVNLLTGSRGELLKHFASHMDVDALAVWNADENDRKTIVEEGAENLKRIAFHTTESITEDDPELIMALQEIKTTWHPVENIKGSGSGY